ncbi:unnamed protein product [Ectocarpus sp. 13 AM-2016]
MAEVGQEHGMVPHAAAGEQEGMWRTTLFIEDHGTHPGFQACTEATPVLRLDGDVARVACIAYAAVLFWHVMTCLHLSTLHCGSVPDCPNHRLLVYRSTGLHSSFGSAQLQMVTPHIPDLQPIATAVRAVVYREAYVLAFTPESCFSEEA